MQEKLKKMQKDARKKNKQIDKEILKLEKKIDSGRNDNILFQIGKL